ncbi:FMN-binding protein [Actinomycetospora endophytica]|uniref:FMN-binding protein n=1 Tax=Actinomycetospora endophytica TaxID=2291215 RepID=A0ABS8PCF7_9PSEU|nr:FMN-binding protein [Actinomycetospora endophytica]MCD2194679.1 FMN-binding protein [Actinomycetospora endophytica]
MTTVPPARFDRGARRIALWGLTTVSTVVLLFSYRTSTSSTMPAATGTTTGTTTSAAGATTSAAAKTSSTYTGTVTGTAADTRWGPVQVKVTLAAGKITAVDVVQEPDSNGRDQEINADAVPQLVSETLSAQSAQIDMVSGATYTSDGYVTSLQSALDQAGVA